MGLQSPDIAISTISRDLPHVYLARSPEGTAVTGDRNLAHLARSGACGWCVVSQLSRIHVFEMYYVLYRVCIL